MDAGQSPNFGRNCTRGEIIGHAAASRQWQRRALQACTVFTATALAATLLALHSHDIMGARSRLALPTRAKTEAVEEGLLRVEEEEEGCHTVEEGEQCYADVLDTQENVIERPDWYPGLTKDSTLEEFQAFLHEQNVCKQPCGLKGKKDKKGCHTSVEGERCYDEVSTTMERYIVHHPESYPGLTAQSSFEEVQAFLHERFSCPKPCGGPAMQEDDEEMEDMFSSPTPANGPKTVKGGNLQCHTAEKSESCYDKVVDAMTYGIRDHPDWPVYTYLMEDSSFEEFQEAIHNENPKVCPQSCTESMLLKIKQAKEEQKNKKKAKAEVKINPKKEVKKDTGVEKKSVGEAKKPTCHTTEKGEACYNSVMWVKTTGLRDHPEWFKTLNHASTFEDIQTHIHNDPKAKTPCPKPCPAPAKPIEPVHSTSCHTAVKGEPCFRSVAWIMSKGISTHPQWFKGLSENSTFEEVQLSIHKDPKAVHPCPKPCEAKCHTSIKGDPCHAAVKWVLQKGLTKHPTWFKGLDNSSTFEAVQAHLHKDLRVSVSCAKPCPPCHTAVKGEKCFDSVRWVMDKGISAHPAWFKDLSKTSSFEDVQEHLHKDPKSDGHCQNPCNSCFTATPHEFTACYNAVSWIKNKGITSHPDWFKGVNKDSTFEQFQDYVHKDPKAKVECPVPCM